MIKDLRKRLRQENAAVSLLVFITVLSFVTILTGAFLTVTTLRKLQLESDIRLQEIYGKDVKRVDQIYNELVGEDKRSPNCEITSNVLNSSYISYKFSFDKEVKGFESEDIQLYNANKVQTSFQNNITLSVSSPAYTVNVVQGKTYIIMFDYESIDNGQFEIGLYSETVPNLPTKTLEATTTKMHEEYKLEVTTSEEIFKIFANVENSNNITISNFEILELQNDEVEKGAFVKVDEKTYTLVGEYNESSRYAIIINKDSFTDANKNKNLEIIKGI